MTEAEELELLELEEAEYQHQKQKSAPKQKGTAQKVLDFANKYTGAPTMSALGAAQEGKNPFKAFATQFGEDPDLAPSGKQIAQRAGISDRPLKDMSDFEYEMLLEQDPLSARDIGAQRDISRSGAAGFLLESAADPLNVALPAAGGLIKGGSKLIKGAAPGIKQFAEKMAVAATGATGKEASKFKPGAGRELLDRGIVKFGSSQREIAENAGEAVAAAERKIDSALESLDAKGVTVDINDVYNQVRSTIAELKKNSSTVDVARTLERELDDVLIAAENRGWQTQIPLRESELTKRGYNKKAKDWTNPEKGQAGKEMYQVFRHATESAAEGHPKLANAFKEGKEAYGLLEPIEDAANRRALTTAQSPPGGLLDVSAAAAGQLAKDPSGGVLTALGRRIVAPRISSSVAVASDKVADKLLRIPEYKKLAANSPELFSALVMQMAAKQASQTTDEPSLGLLRSEGR